MTGDHLINVKEKGFVKAAIVKINDKIRVYSSENKVSESVIVKISKYVKEGFIAPLSDTGTILVNNIDASCYADVNNQLIANIAMKPLVLWHKLNKLIGIPSTKMDYGVNAYASALNRFSLTFLPMIFD